MIAGGSDSTSNAEIKLPQKLVHAAAPLALGKRDAGRPARRRSSQLMPLSDVLPREPKIAERTTGKVMGEAAEEMARRNEISREAQDEFAVRSHQRAAAAIATGRFGARGRPGRDAERPAGSTPTPWCAATPASRSWPSCGRRSPRTARVTAGNCQPAHRRRRRRAADERGKGAGARADAAGAFRQLGLLGVDPADQLLMGPALAMPQALDRAGASWPTSTSSTCTRPSRRRC